MEQKRGGGKADLLNKEKHSSGQWDSQVKCYSLGSKLSFECSVWLSKMSRVLAYDTPCCVQCLIFQDVEPRCSLIGEFISLRILIRVWLHRSGSSPFSLCMLP